MKYTPQNNLTATANLQAYIAKNNLSSKVDLEKTGTIMTAPVDGATGVNIAGPLEWEQYDSFLRYRLIVTRDSDSAEVVNTTVVGTSYDTDLDASTLYSWKVYAITPKPQSSPDPTPNVTGINFSPSSPTLGIDDTVQISATVTGTDLTDTTVTWSKVSGDADLTIDSSTDNTVTIISAGTASDTDSAVFRATADQDGTTTADVTVTVEAVTLDDSTAGDLQALKDIYDVTDGDNWTNSWDRDNLTTSNMGDAYGVTVYPSGHANEGRVQEINLFQNGLVNIEVDGSGDPVLDSNDRYQLLSGMELKETIGNLQKMEYIDLRMNLLGGDIPDSFWTIVSFKVIALGFREQTRYGRSNDLKTETLPYPSKRDYNGTKFTGSLPSAIGNLVNLERLFLERNYFDNNAIPSELWDLPNITHLCISLNGFTSIPQTEPAFTGLEVIQFYGGTATSWRENTSRPSDDIYITSDLPPGLSVCTDLVVIRASLNNFGSSVPSSWSALVNLQTIQIDNAGLTGDFPTFFNNDNMPNLTTIRLNRNSMGGSLPTDYNISNLSDFQINSNNLTGNIPLTWQDSNHVNFPDRLKILDLISNGFSGDFMDSLSPMFRPRWIWVHNNNFSGSLPSVFPVSNSSDAGEFGGINFFGNGFTGAIPEGLGDMTSSRPMYVSLSNNSLTSYETGAISPVVLSGGDYVSGLRSLEKFYVSNNSLSQSDLNQIILDLWDNVQSRQGTEWENWGIGTLSMTGQSTGASPSDTSEINTAITGLENAGWTVNVD